MKQIFSIIALCGSIMFVVSCGNRQNGLEPADVVVAFNKAMATCQFEEAAKLCNAETMQTYINTCKEFYDANVKKDKKVTESAVETFSKVETVIGEIVKERGVRTISYSLKDSYGSTKEKVAVLKDVEGEWKIEEIKDKQ